MPFPLSRRRAAARNWFHKLLLALCLGLIASSSNAQGVLINHGLDGSWYNPASPGQGMFLETVPSMNLLWGGWYTFDDSGSATDDLCYDDQDRAAISALAVGARWSSPDQGDWHTVERLA